MANVVVPPFTEAPSTVVGGTPTSVFPFDFPFWAAADILVYVDGVPLASSAYSVEGFAIQDAEPVEGGFGSGEVTLDTPVSGVTVTIDRLVVGDRQTQFSRSVPLGMPALNGDLNRLTARQQDLRRRQAALEALGLDATQITAELAAAVVARTGAQAAQTASETAQGLSEGARDAAQGYASDAAGVSGVNVPSYASRASLGGATVAAAIKQIATRGYASEGDGGGANYVRTSFATITSAGYPAASYQRSLDRFMPDGSTDATNGGYWMLREGVVAPEMLGTASDTAAVTAALALGGQIKFSPRAYSLPTAIPITADVHLDFGDAVIVGAGSETGGSIFTCFDGNRKVQVSGGKFSGALAAFNIGNIHSLTVVGGDYDDLIHGITIETTVSAGAVRVLGANFNDIESGVNLQSSLFSIVDISHCRATNVQEKTRTGRPYPYDKKVSTAFYYKASAGAGSFVSVGCYVKGVTPYAIPGSEPETHAILVSLDDAYETTCIIQSFTAIDVATNSLTGAEGIGGRARYVIIDDCIGIDAGGQEGMIYAKGSTYHKITDCTLAATSGNPDLASLRGIISTADNSDISGNKIIGIPIGVYSRANTAKYGNNQFFGVATCYTLAVNDGATHVETVIHDDVVASDCTNFFSMAAPSGGATYGTIQLRGNTLNQTGRTAILQACSRLLFIGANVVNRIAPDASREVFSFLGVVGEIIVRGNEFVCFQDSNSTGRVITGNTTNTPKITFRNNSFGVGNAALWTTGQTYVDYIISDNDFAAALPLKINGVVGTNVTVTGALRVRDNTGYVTENRGKGTVLAGQTQLIVTHGLSLTPTILNFTPWANEAVWISNVSSTSFRINRAVTTNALEVSWDAAV